MLLKLTLKRYSKLIKINQNLSTNVTQIVPPNYFKLLKTDPKTLLKIIQNKSTNDTQIHPRTLLKIT